MIDFSKNYFELFSLPVQYSVEMQTLAINFRQLQSEYHPDKFASASEQERRVSVQTSSLLNEAQTTLKNDILRAQYLLSIKDIAFNTELETVKDVSFLMQQLELREALENVSSAEDSFEKLDALRDDVGKQLAILVGLMTGWFDELSDESIILVKDSILKMQFLQKFQHEADLAEEKLDEDF